MESPSRFFKVLLPVVLLLGSSQHPAETPDNVKALVPGLAHTKRKPWAQSAAVGILLTEERQEREGQSDAFWRWRSETWI